MSGIQVKRNMHLCYYFQCQNAYEEDFRSSVTTLPRHKKQVKRYKPNISML